MGNNDGTSCSRKRSSQHLTSNVDTNLDQLINLDHLSMEDL